MFSTCVSPTNPVKKHQTSIAAAGTTSQKVSLTSRPARRMRILQHTCQPALCVVSLRPHIPTTRGVLACASQLVPLSSQPQRRIFFRNRHVDRRTQGRKGRAAHSHCPKNEAVFVSSPTHSTRRPSSTGARIACMGALLAVTDALASEILHVCSVCEPPAAWTSGHQAWPAS